MSELRIPIEEAGPLETDLERIHRQALEIADQFIQAIDEMLAGQPGPKVSELIRTNLLAYIEAYYTGSPAGIELSDQQRKEVLNVACIEMQSFLKLPRTPDGFISGQVVIDPLLRDNQRNFDNPESRAIQPNELADGQSRIMRELNLSDYEGHTTDTSQTLQHLMPYFFDPMLLATAKDDKHLQVLEPGIGEGRIAIPLLLLGCDVQGLDLSPRTIDRLRQRLDKAAQDLANHNFDGNLAPVADAFQQTGLDFEALAAENGQSMQTKLEVREGNFLQPESFDHIPDDSIDVCPIMWHTFGFAGDHDTEMILLDSIYQKLRPGGLLLIEMPDPNFGPYAEAIDSFDREETAKARFNPQYQRYPRGTIIDAPAQGDSPTSTEAEAKAIRYFPDFSELCKTLIQAGFMQTDIKPYFVKQLVQNRELLIIKEGLIVTQKPFSREQIENIDRAKLMELELQKPLRPGDERKRPD